MGGPRVRATLMRMRWPTIMTAWKGYPLAATTVVLATALLLPFRAVLHPAQVMLLYVPLIVGVARATGIGASVFAACLAFVALDLAFVVPYYVFAVSSPVDWVTLLVFLLVAIAAGTQAGWLRRRERAAVAREREVSMLYRLSSRLVSEESPEAMNALIVGDVVVVLGADRAALYADEDGRASLLAEAGGASSGPGERVLADWVLVADRAIGLPEATDPDERPRPASVTPDAAADGVVADGIYLPLRTRDGLAGVLYARPLSGSVPSDEAARQLLAVSNLAAAYLERRRLEAEAARLEAAGQSERLKSTLVASVSHELKTPLAAVHARVTGLLEEGEGCDAARVRDELTAVSEDLVRLDSSIRDLLDFSRLESDSWRPCPEDYELSEILGTVAAKLPASQRARVTFEIPDGLPLVRVDFAQIARAFSNLVENALLYAPAGSPVRVGARVLGTELLAWVEDDGPGVPDSEKALVFEKFHRGAASGAAPGGTGLGLAIAREIVRSHGGRIWVDDAPGGGARFVLSLPLQGGSR